MFKSLGDLAGLWVELTLSFKTFNSKDWFCKKIEKIEKKSKNELFKPSSIF